VVERLNPQLSHRWTQCQNSLLFVNLWLLNDLKRNSFFQQCFEIKFVTEQKRREQMTNHHLKSWTMMRFFMSSFRMKSTTFGSVSNSWHEIFMNIFALWISWKGVTQNSNPSMRIPSANQPTENAYSYLSMISRAIHFAVPQNI
jgi:hypothetical protein